VGAATGGLTVRVESNCVQPRVSATDQSSQVEWGPSVETANGTRQNVNGGKLENNILVQ
jgi:hypothetical protein